MDEKICPRVGRSRLTFLYPVAILLFIALVKWMWISPSSDLISLDLHHLQPPPPPIAMDLDIQIEFDFAPFLRLYKSGRIERLINPPFVPAGVDSRSGVISKDVVIDPDSGLTVRLYLPRNFSGNGEEKLPIVVYFHGGAFVIESTFSPTYHGYLNSLTAKANAVIVSVEYRLAPEHPLPVAYDDSLKALKWVASQARGHREAWLANHGDFERIFLAGDSAGGNIAHNILLRTREDELENQVKIKGLALLNPYFWGKERLDKETSDPMTIHHLETTWEFVCGWRMGIDSPMVDPIEAGAGQLRGLPCRMIYISVAEKDVFRERGRAYYKALKEQGWEGEVELHETEGEQHVYYLSNPNSEKARAEMERLVVFFNRE